MRGALRGGAWLVALVAAGAGASPPVAAPEDPVLAGLIDEALAKRPELAEARALVEAGRQRVAPAGALADPTVTLGIQNDGFGSLQIGVAETSWLTIMASETIPWPGRLDLRTELARLGVGGLEADVDRANRSVRASVERGYFDLLLARAELTLLGRSEALWRESEGLAQTRYEAGEGAQSDLLRAQLERTRLRQRRLGLETVERQRLAQLNRLRGHPLDEALETPRELVDCPEPAALDVAQATSEAEAHSPELAKARLLVTQVEKQVALADLAVFPDPTVSAGVMPRGKLEPMWQLNLSFALPVWMGSKQSHEVAEAQARLKAARHAVAALEGLLRQRVRERALALDSLREANQLYRSGLLVQSEAAVKSTVAQYQVGRVTFASVLEVLSGLLADESGWLSSLAEAQRVAIAQRELSLEPSGASSSGGVGGASMPGAQNLSAGAPGGAGGSGVTSAEGRPSPGAGPSMQKM